MISFSTQSERVLRFHGHVLLGVMPLMRPEAAQIGEALIADAAVVRFLARVNAQVCFQHVRPRERFGTLSAAVRAFFSVNPFMLLQVDAIEEAVATEGALERPLALLTHVDPFVCVKMLWI